MINQTNFSELNSSLPLSVNREDNSTDVRENLRTTQTVTAEQIHHISKDLKDLHLWTGIKNFARQNLTLKMDDNPETQWAINFIDGRYSVPQRPDFHQFNVETHMNEVGTIAANIVGVSIENGQYGFIENSSQVVDHLSINTQESDEITERKNLLESTRGKAELSFDYNEAELLVLLAYLHDIEKVLEPDLNLGYFNENGNLVRAKIIHTESSYTSGKSESQKIPNMFDASEYLPQLPEEFANSPTVQSDKAAQLTLRYIWRLKEIGILTANQAKYMINTHITYLSVTDFVKDKGESIPEEIKQSEYYNQALILCIADELGKGTRFEDNSDKAVQKRRVKISKLQTLTNDVQI
jgi:hypothetical protein